MKDIGAFAINLSRYSLATIGPVGSAASQFLLSLVLLHALDAASFGRFSFLLVTAQFSWGIWSALFCAPLPALLTTGEAGSHARLLRCLFTTNLLAAGVPCVLFLCLGLGLGETAIASGLFAAYAAAALLRWFARAHAYATGVPIKAAMSDLVYSAVLVAGVALVASGWTATVDFAYGVLLVGAILGLLPFGWTFLGDQFLRVATRDVRSYMEIWRRHSGWSLLGVLSTELTTNAHVYIVTLLYGPQVFAPIAASALMIRPINVAMNALTEFERARMARQIGLGQIEFAISAVRLFRIVLIATWIATAIAIVVLFKYKPGLIFPPQYDLSLLVEGTALWMAVACVRLLRAPDSALLQAAGAFRALALASVVSAGISVLAVGALVAVSGALWSIAGIFLGEIVFAAWTWRQARTWKKASRGANEPDGIVAVAEESAETKGGR